MKKFSRPLCLFLSLIIFCIFFVVPSSAAENLVDPDLRNWSNASVSGSVSSIPDNNILVINYGSFFRLRPKYIGQVGNDNSYVYLGYIFDVSDIFVNHSYRFSVSIPSIELLQSHSELKNWTADYLVNGYKNGALNISFGVVKSDGSVESFVDLLSITADNYQDLLGTKYVTNFTCPSYSGGNPCIVIYCTSVSETGSYQANYWLGKDMSLIDEDAAEEDSFFDRLFQFFQEKFNSLGNSFISLGDRISSFFSNLGDIISGFFENLGQKLEDGLNGLLEGVVGWFQKLGNLILYLTWSDEVPENPFQSEDGPLDKAEGFFDGLIDYLRNIKTDLLNVIDSVTAGIHVFDLFTERFPWVKTLCLFAFALIIFSRFVGI